MKLITAHLSALFHDQTIQIDMARLFLNSDTHKIINIYLFQPLAQIEVIIKYFCTLCAASRVLV